MFLKKVHIFDAHFQIFLVKNAPNDSEFIEPFFVNYSENHRIFQGGSMGKIIGRGIPHILQFILLSRRLAITVAEEI